MRNGTRYEFRVLARNVVGLSSPSNVATAVPRPSQAAAAAEASLASTDTTVPATEATAPTTTTPPVTVAAYAMGDLVWLDANGDGRQDGDERGVPGVVVRLVDAAGRVIDETTTDGEGRYRFDDVSAGRQS